MGTAQGLSEQDVAAARTGLSEGRAVTVWFTPAAVGVPAGGSAKIVSVEEVAEGDFIQVRPTGSRDTMFCSPGELTRTRPPRRTGGPGTPKARRGAAAAVVLPADRSVVGGSAAGGSAQRPPAGGSPAERSPAGQSSVTRSAGGGSSVGGFGTERSAGGGPGASGSSAGRSPGERSPAARSGPGGSGTERSAGEGSAAGDSSAGRSPGERSPAARSGSSGSSAGQPSADRPPADPSVAPERPGRRRTAAAAGPSSRVAAHPPSVSPPSVSPPSGPPAPQPGRGGRAARPPAEVSVVLSATGEGEWTVEVTVGRKRTVRPTPVQPGDVAAAARALPPAVAEAISSSLDAARRRRAEQVERLRAELEAAERALKELNG